MKFVNIQVIGMSAFNAVVNAPTLPFHVLTLLPRQKETVWVGLFSVRNIKKYRHLTNKNRDTS